MKTCGTCRFWNQDTSPQNIGSKTDSAFPGQCMLAKTVNGTSDWLVEQGPREILALALDNERYAAQLHTKATFGCIQHEPRHQ